MIPRGGRGRVSRVLVAVAVASFLLLFLALPVGRGRASRRPGGASSSSSNRGPAAPAPTSSALVRGAFLASAAATLAVVWWRRRRAGASRGGKPPARARRARWDGSRWVELETEDADPTRSTTTTTRSAPPRGPFASGASVQRPPGPAAHDPTIPFAPKTSAPGATNGVNGSHQTYQSDDTIDEFARWDAAEASRWARVELEDEERRRAQEEREEEREHRAAARKERKRERRAAEKAERERGRVASAKERWAAHEARWATLEADPPVGSGAGSGSAGPLRYDDVPWPPKMTAMLRAACGDGGEGERKAAYRRLIRRWHPDKFGARFGERVRAGGEEARVMERVNAVARALNQEFAGRA